MSVIHKTHWKVNMQQTVFTVAASLSIESVGCLDEEHFMTVKNLFNTASFPTCGQAHMWIGECARTSWNNASGVTGSITHVLFSSKQSSNTGQLEADDSK